MIHITESIWERVRVHGWKYRPRTRTIDAILLHATRGNQGYPGNIELGAFINWMVSSGNYNPGAPVYGIEPYAGISHYGTGPWRKVEVVPPQLFIPAWSSWPSDEHAISIEVAQSNLGQPIEPETIQSTVELVRDLQAEFGIPSDRIFPVNDAVWTGMTGHEDTVQGKAQGKSDPGAAFWVPFTEALGGDEMTPDQLSRLERLERLMGGNGIAKDPAAYIASGMNPQLLTFGEAALAYAQQQGWSVLLGVGLARAEAQHTHTPGVPGGTHTHNSGPPIPS